MHKKLTTNDYSGLKNLQVYKVGGYVRDKLLNLPVSDTDYVVVGSTPEEMINLGFKPVGKDFPVFLHPLTREEYALARSEKKSGRGHRGFIFFTSPEITLAEDLQRRDITINAIAEDKDGQLIDPFNGRGDLDNKIIRHISPAFIEDPLRVLRVARFSAKLNFKIAEETMSLMQQITLGSELSSISRERIWLEISKALMTKMSTKFFAILNKIGALAIILPEFVPLITDATAFNTLTNIAQHMDYAQYNLEQRFAIFYYFLGTKYTLAETEKFIDQSVVGSKAKTLTHLLVRYYNAVHILDKLSHDDIYTMITYLDPKRRIERYQTFTELVSMIATSIGDTKTILHLKLLKKMIAHFNQINYGQLKNESPNDFIDQSRKLKYTIIAQVALEMPTNY